MEMVSVPAWLNNEFVEKALNLKKENGSKVVSSEITRATAPGDNYGSEMYRAVVQMLNNDVQEKKSFIIKAELTSVEMRKVMSEGNAFGREINAFNNVIPNLDKILTDCVPNKYQPFAPKCYYTHEGQPASVLVLEDLRESGFKLAKPLEGLDLKHCFVTINSLAVHHAASAVLYVKHPEKLKPFRTSQYSENMRGNVEKIFNPVLKQLALEAENWPECKGVIARKIRELEPKTFDHIMECVKTDDEAFNVFCHEDSWLNNLMFQYSEETKKVTDVRFVDFQVCQWTSPAVDLLYFINATAASPIVKRPHLIIDQYYKTLKETLNTLGFDHLCPSKNHLLEEYQKKHKFGVIMACVLRHVMFMDRKDVPDMEKILKNEVEIKFSERYKKDMRELLAVFHHKRWL